MAINNESIKQLSKKLTKDMENLSNTLFQISDNYKKLFENTN